MLFGSPVITAPELVRVLLDDVEPDVRAQMGVTGKPTQNQRDRSTEWTLAVKRVLSILGNNLGCQVYCGGERFLGELMLDVLWCSGTLACAGIALACESEWQYANDVSYDFQKLLVVKAPLKLLTYSGRKSMAEAIRARAKQDMELYPYHVTGEEYIFVGLDFGIGCAHRYVVPCDGRQTNIVLEALVDARPAVSA